MIGIYLYFGAVYDSHPRRPDFVRRPLSKMVEIGAHAGVVVRLGQFNSWTGEGAVTTDLVQCVSVSRVVTSVATLIQRLQTITLRKGTNSS